MDAGTQFCSSEAIAASLAVFAARCVDPAETVYARVFAACPPLEDLFRRDARGLVRGEMLARAFEVILDYVGDRRYATAMIRAELITHEGYAVSGPIFLSFFERIRDAVRDTIAEAWTADVAAAWAALLAEFAELVDVTPDGGKDAGPL